MKRSVYLMVLLALLLLAPFVAPALGLEYYIGFATRVIATMLIATSLHLLMGYGGMIALGHAGFVGVGAYVMVALVIGAICLRTRGVYFIMITLAFAQMLYYIVVSMRNLGGDDGYNLNARPLLGLGLDSGNERTLYLVVLIVSVLVFALINRLTQSRFGKTLVGMRDNEARMNALGYPTYRLRLQAFVLTAAIAGLGGAMLLTQNSFVSPSSMHWTQSAILVVMVVIGGLGHRYGAVVGAGIWLCLEESLRQYTEYWHWPLGALLILIILFAPQGVCNVSLKKRSPNKPLAQEGKTA